MLNPFLIANFGNVNMWHFFFLKDGQWSKPTKWDSEIAHIMRDIFGISGSFRHHQKEAINAAMSGADVR